MIQIATFEDQQQLRQQQRNIRVQCYVCGRYVRAIGLHDHLKDAHARKEGVQALQTLAEIAHQIDYPNAWDTDEYPDLAIAIFKALEND